MRPNLLHLAVVLLALGSAQCRKGAADTATQARVASADRGCSHDLTSAAVAPHAWPFPAEYRDLRWKGGYEKSQLRLKPNRAALVTATVAWKNGDMLRVLDSEVRITKPRLLTAKRDIVVKRKVWDQGTQVSRDFLVAAKGEPTRFLFYNSRGLCMIDGEEGLGWIRCALDDTFEGLTAADPHPCAQEWWVKVQRGKAAKGWMLFDPALMERVAPESAPAR